MGHLGVPFNLDIIVTQQLEQSSEVLAEDNLPTTLPKHLEQCMELSSDLVNDSIPIIRCIYSIDGRVSLGILLAETRDSFLVGAATRLIMSPEGDITSNPVSTEPVIRLMKSGISYITTASDASRYHYFMFLRNQGAHYLPDYFTEEVLLLVTEYIKKYEFENNLDLPKGKSAFVKLNIKGTSKFAFKSHILSEKIH